MAQPCEMSKCACPTCQCPVPAGKGIVRNGKVYCSQTCAYDCTDGCMNCGQQYAAELEQETGLMELPLCTRT